MQNRRRDITIAAVSAFVFGVLTVLAGGSALFGGSGIRAVIGDAVMFVLWFNFVAGFAYVAAGVGLFFRESWAVGLSIAILLSTKLMLVAFGVHALIGGAYEVRTVWAMSLRLIFWAVVVGAVTGDETDFSRKSED